MTSKEALEILSSVLYSTSPDWQKKREQALKVVDRLVERDKPMKIDFSKDEYECPYCTTKIEWTEILRGKWTFCAECGQRLDWSE